MRERHEPAIEEGAGVVLPSEESATRSPVWVAAVRLLLLLAKLASLSATNSHSC